MAHYAHTRDGRPATEWEPLADHLRRVADLAGGFAETFSARQWGEVAGWWHDLGKYSKEFQQYLYSSSGLEAHLETRGGRVDHSTAGAQHAVSFLGGTIGRVLAFCLAGHHGGMPDAVDTDGTKGLTDRLWKSVPAYDDVPTELLTQQRLTAPPFDWSPGRQVQCFQRAAFARFVFSCLVDADYLATEGFMRPDQADARRAETPSFELLLGVLDEYLAQLVRRAADTEVNRRRGAVLDSCRAAATSAPGFFSLAVPTGGGKTLSSLAFALKHAVERHLRRVIYAIPFTSIIEQNADVFRRALAGAGPHAVLEHHSNLEPEKETRWGRFAAENWDAPIVVTTNVQLYESLFANKPGRCRKLHNIVRSVIVLDEVQTLPVHLLRPTLAMLDELRRNYGCTIVLCSATQPAVALRDDFKIGLHDVRPIISEEKPLFDALKRVDVEQLGALDDEELASRLRDHERVLCVVNTRGHAARLFELLRDETGDDKAVFHLSTYMCPQHRRVTLGVIRRRLRQQLPCRVISTQLIEAGVDIDFPVVYRSHAGLDSIAQAAGRCNREGRLFPERGRVFVFDGEISKCTPEIQMGADKAREIADLHDDPLSLDAVEDYFKLYYWQRQDEWDSRDVMGCFGRGSSGPHFQFRQAAERYRLIDRCQTPIIVPYDRRGRHLVKEFHKSPEERPRDLARRLQRYSVGVYEHELRQLSDDQVITPYDEQFWVLERGDAYCQQLGLRFDQSGIDPESRYI